MIIEAFGKEKDVMDWLDDPRIHPEITRDVLVKRIKRHTDPEEALTKPVIKGAGVGDTKQRISARVDKMKHRVKMFKLGQSVRRQYEDGVEIKEIMENNNLSKSQVVKIGNKMEWYNIHWAGKKVPEEYRNYTETEYEGDKLTGVKNDTV